MAQQVPAQNKTVRILEQPSGGPAAFKRDHTVRGGVDAKVVLKDATWLDHRATIVGHNGPRMTVGRIEVAQERLAEFCRRNGVRKLALFGSVLTDRFSDASDIDVLVEFEPGQRIGYLRMAGMERELSAILGGRKVDLRTPSELSRYFRDEVLRTAVVQYAAE
jgi:predicted nucleotidyltransferase